ncbi:MAG: hypothetical protein ACOY93_04370 [Bacillota bacterium]
MSAAFLQQLLRLLHADPAVRAAYLGGDMARPAPEQIERVDLHLAAEPPFREALGERLAAAGETAYSGAEGDGWRAVTPDGVEWRFYLYAPAEPFPAGLQPLFDRREGSAGGAGPAPGGSALDLTGMAGRFWADLYRAARELGQGRCLAAHGYLEACRQALVDLYRLAAAPAELGRGWEGADQIAALAPVREWLVAPLELRAQWRCAHRLAAGYESLMLPLCQRLGLSYPMAMRNLAFGRLDQVRPDRAEAGGRPEPPPPEPVRPEPSGRMRLAKGRIPRP